MLTEGIRKEELSSEKVVVAPTLTGKLLARNTVFNLVGQALPMLVAVITIPIIIRALGVGRFGVLTLAWMVVGYFSLLDLGLGRATTKFVAEFLSRGESDRCARLVWASVLMLFGLGLFGAVAAIFIMPWLVNNILNIPPELKQESLKAFYLLAISIPIVTTTAGMRGVLEATQRFDLINYVKIPTYIAAFAAPLAVLPFSVNLFPIVLVLIASRLAGLLAYTWFCLRSMPALLRPKLPSRNTIKRLLGYGGWLTVSHIIWPIMTYLDRFIVGAMLTMAAVAYYATPYELVAKLMIITGSLTSVVFPAFSAYAARQPKKLLKLHNRTIKYLLLSLVPIVFVIIVMATPFFKIWIGTDFALNSAIILQILALAKLINSVSQVPSSAIQAMGRPDITAKLHLIELPIYLVLVWMLINSFGIVGAAVAWLLRTVLDTSLYFWLFYRLSPLRLEDRKKPETRLIIWAVVMLLMAFLFTALPGLVLRIGLTAVVVMIAIYYCWKKFLDADEKGYVMGVISKIIKIADIQARFKKAIRKLFFRNRRPIVAMFERYRSSQFLPKDILAGRQLEQLNKLLNHAYKNVPYYRELLKDSALREDDKIVLRSIRDLEQIPFLTKENIRSERERIYSLDHKSRKSYRNSSGGSTGEPVVILQDRDYLISEGATFLLPKSWKGVDPYDSEIIIWGAERDTFRGKKPLIDQIKDFLRNRITLNSFRMTPNDMKNYIEILNRQKPKMIRAYADSIYEIAAYARRSGIQAEPQNAIHTAACSLHDFMRSKIEAVFQCPVFNHYGCREVGSIASECAAHDGLHILMEHNLVEIVDEGGHRCEPGQEGEIVVTNLDNFSMPIIRYRIGDVGVMKTDAECSCGCNYPKLEKVTGRVTDAFKTADGRVISPIYFAHLLGVVHSGSGIRKFQIVQKDYQRVIIRIAKDGEINPVACEDIRNKVGLVMGADCNVELNFVDDIETTRTGKFRFTVSEVNCAR